MSYLFICHSSSDKEFVRELKTSLIRFHIRVWVDEGEMNGGETLKPHITKAISEMEYFGIVLTPDAIRSEYVLKELKEALKQKVGRKKGKIIPIILKRTEDDKLLKKIPKPLRKVNYISFEERNKLKGNMPRDPLNKLVNSLGVDPVDAECWSGKRVTTVENLRRRLEEYFSPLAVELRLFGDGSGIENIVVDNRDGTYQIYCYRSRPSDIALINDVFCSESEKPIIDIQMVDDLIWKDEERNSVVKNICVRYSITESEFWDASNERVIGRNKLPKKVNSAWLDYEAWLTEQSLISLISKQDFGAPPPL